MYAALWRLLPGPWWVRVTMLLALAVGAMYGLFFHLFPWIASTVVPDAGTIGAATPGP